MYTYYAVTHVLKSGYTLVTVTKARLRGLPTTMGARVPARADLLTDHHPAPNDAGRRSRGTANRVLNRNGVIVGSMKPVIDDLPVVLASRLRATGEIGPDTRAATIRFDNGESGVEFVVGIVQRRFSNGGAWSKFVCPCGRRAQKLRLFEGRPACGHCVRAAGIQYRSDMCSHFSKRAALTAPKRIERLNSDIPARLHPRRGRMLDRRANLELRLKRSLIVERRSKIARFEKDQGEA
jgi:hypothetical protein